MASILDGASDADLKRMATLWLYSDMSATNWEAAHTAYDPEKKTQLASFKTVSNRTLSKYKKAVAAGAGGTPDNGTVASEAAGDQSDKPKKTAVKKRKSAAEMVGDGEEGDESPAKKTKAAPTSRAKKGAKKASAEEVTAGEDEETVKAESSDVSGV